MKLTKLFTGIICGLIFLFVPALFAQPKVVGYLPVNYIKDADINRISFGKLTHLNLAFLNPDSSGNFLVPAAVDLIVAKAHINNVKVLISIAGGNAPGYYSKLLNDANKDYITENIVRIITEHQLDGLDVDLEGNSIDEYYTSFISGLSYLLRRENKLLTAAVATAYSPKISNKALSFLDFVNIMSYDKTGPWTPGNPGQHAPFSMAEEDILFWTQTRGLSKKKIILGVPFYGYQFGKDTIPAWRYADIISRFPGAEETDSVFVNDGSIIFYNGKETIKKKTRLAVQKTGGIMIWQILQDADGPGSLLNVIDETLRQSKRKNRQL